MATICILPQYQKHKYQNHNNVQIHIRGSPKTQFHVRKRRCLRHKTLMPGGRPKAVIPPCRHCSKQFKRQEHLIRHERTHTHEKPFACDCGQSFTRRDLLARHARISHQECSRISESSSEVMQVLPINGDTAVGLNDHDLFWDPDFMEQDILPAMLFDADFQFSQPLPDSEPPRLRNLFRFSSRLPQLEDTEDGPENDTEEIVAGAAPWSISEGCYQKLYDEFQGFSGATPPGFSLPSRSNLTRYLEKYLVCIQEFLPFIHVATFSVEKENIELLLAMAAHGAMYLFERPQAYLLYFIAKGILFERLHCEDLQLVSDSVFGQESLTPNEEEVLGTIQTLILLISFASWGDRRTCRDSLSMGSQLCLLTRESGISEPDEMPHDIGWLLWVAAEKRRRTLLAAYIVLNLHSIAFDIPPLILNHEVGVFLPDFAVQWKAKNEREWKQAARQVERSFQEALRYLIDDSEIPRDGSLSSFSNYLLIHGLLQQIYIDRHGCAGLRQLETIQCLESALRAWQISFELGDDPSLDPLAAKGAFGLTGAALLRLAYIRLNTGFRTGKGLMSRDLTGIMRTRSNLNGSSQVNKAVLHAAHALSIPVRLGIPFIARTKTPIWSIEHSLCCLECAIFLRDWLELISRTVKPLGIEGLSKVENKLLGIVTGIVKESHLAETLDIIEDDVSRYERMAGTVVKLWAQIFQGAHILDIDITIGATLQLLADAPSPS